MILRRLLWFTAFWAAGVVAVAIVAGLIHWALSLAR